MISSTSESIARLLAARPRQVQAVGDDVALGAMMGADADVVGTDMRGNSATFWKVRPMPMSQMRCGGRVQDARALDQDIALARLIEAAQAIEQGRLAGAVRADQSENLPLALVERDVVQRDNAAEHNAHLANGKQDVALRCYSSVHVWRPVAGVEHLFFWWPGTLSLARSLDLTCNSSSSGSRSSCSCWLWCQD